MRRLITTVTPPVQTALTTVAAVKDELPGNLTGSALARLAAVIEQASALIVGRIGKELVLATVKETIVWGADDPHIAPLTLCLSRPPVASLVAVAFDGVDQDLATLDYDENSGLMYRHTYGYNLDYNIIPGGYWFGYRTEITYQGGYMPPGQAGRNLPYGIERACIDLTLALWHRSGRGDPMIRSESIDGIGSTQYLDPLPGADAGMPPAVIAALMPFCDYGV